MITDRPPHSGGQQAGFEESDRLDSLDVPRDDRLPSAAELIEAAMQAGQRVAVRKACGDFLAAAAEFYGVTNPWLRVLEARPLQVREGGWATELFGDYHPERVLIRVWMRTAVRRQVTSFGTLLSTLCHEFCHHLDFTRLGLCDSPHTRGFHSRAAVLYHHARGTPVKRLFWVPLRDGRWRIDWPRTNRGK